MSWLGIDIHHSNLGSIRIASFSGSQRILPGLQPDSAMEPQPILPGLQFDAPGTQLNSHYPMAAPLLSPMAARPLSRPSEARPQVISPITSDRGRANSAEAEQILQAPCGLDPSSAYCLPEQLSRSLVFGRELPPSLLITAAAEHRQHLQQPHKAPRFFTGNSNSLHERKRIHESGGVGFPHHYPTQTEDEFNDLDLLFRILLAALKKPREVEGGKGLLQRMPVQPKTATVPEEFHSKFGKRFGQGCRPPWLQMTLPQRGTRLHSFLFTKFSLDKKMRCMLPGPGLPKKPRNEACWREFWLSDAELNSVVAETMEEYGRMCD